MQGCVYKDLRTDSAKFVADLGAEGNAIGGLAVGEPTEAMYDMIEVVNEILPEDKPRYLMGVGTPANILEAIDRGVDMMDCVMPTRNGRNGMLFTQHGIMNMRNKKWADDFHHFKKMALRLWIRFTLKPTFVTYSSHKRFWRCKLQAFIISHSICGL